MASSAGSDTDWIRQLEAGDPIAARELWQRYYHRLVPLARSKLRGAPRRAADEEDVALSAFDSFFRGAEQGRFPQLADRHDLWQILVVVTARKAANLIRHEHRQKRDAGRMQSYAVATDSDDAPPLADIIGREPTPEFAAQVADEVRRLLDKLKDEELRSVALWKMEGYTNDEIAAKLGCVPRTVERKLRVIRGEWEHETDP